MFECPALWFRLPNQFKDVFDLRPVGSFVDGYWSIAVLCLTETPTSMPMWAHYGDGGEGIALEFSADSNFFKEHALAKVRYSAKRPTVSEPIKALTTKSAEWAYEREWRCFAVPGERQQDQFLFDQQAVSVSFPFEALTAVIHGHDSRVDASPLLARAEAKHVRELVCRVDPWAYKVNVCDRNDFTYIHERQRAAIWGRQSRK